MKHATAREVAVLFGVPLENVKGAYASNAKELRESALKAGAGQYRGKTALEWNRFAEHAERQAK